MSFAASTRPRSGPVVPMAAMVDILFLLLVFFVTASSLRDHDRVIEVTLPGTETDQSGSGSTPIIITVDAEGRTSIGGQVFTLAELRKKLSQRAEKYPDDPVDLRGDTRCDFGTMISVFDAVRAAGMRHVNIHTRPVLQVMGEE